MIKYKYYLVWFFMTYLGVNLCVSALHSQTSSSSLSTQNQDISSWSLLLSGQFPKALQLEQRKVFQSSSENVNYAHALLFNGRYTDAEKVYLKNIGTNKTNSGRLWETVVFKDFQELQDSGVYVPTVDSIRRMLSNAIRERSHKGTPNDIRSVAIRACANKKFLSVVKQTITYKYADNGKILIPEFSILANKNEVGKLERFTLSRTSDDPYQPRALNRATISFNMGVYESHLALQPTKVYTNQLFTETIPVLMPDKIVAFELIPIDSVKVLLRDESGKYLQVTSPENGDSPLSMHEKSNDGLFEFVNPLTGSPLLHGLNTVSGITGVHSYQTQKTILAVAPIGENELIGKGYRDGFLTSNQVILGKNDTLLKDQVNYASREFIRIDNELMVGLNLNFLGLFGADVTSKQTERFAILSACKIDKAVVLKQPIIPSDIGSNVKMYISKVYYGWAAHHVIKGTVDIFSGEIAGKIKMIGGGMKLNNIESRLTMDARLYGFEESKLNANDIWDINAYLNSYSKAQYPVPIFVEYTIIENFNTPTIEWR